MPLAVRFSAPMTADQKAWLASTQLPLRSISLDVEDSSAMEVLSSPVSPQASAKHVCRVWCQSLGR